MALNSKNGFIGSGIYRCYDGFTHEEGNNVKIEITGALAWSEGYSRIISNCNSIQYRTVLCAMKREAFICRYKATGYISTVPMVKSNSTKI